MVAAFPSFRQARLNLPPMSSPKPGWRGFQEQLAAVPPGSLAGKAIPTRLGLNPEEVERSHFSARAMPNRTVLTRGRRADVDLDRDGLARSWSTAVESSRTAPANTLFQLATRPMLLVRDDLYVRHVNRVLVTRLTAPELGDDALRIACELVRVTFPVACSRKST